MSRAGEARDFTAKIDRGGCGEGRSWEGFCEKARDQRYGRDKPLCGRQLFF